MPAISRIEFSPDLTEQVYQRLSDAICNGDLVPGARLTQEELAASLDVSRQPVLQALRLLRKDGFVIDAGRRGMMVAPLDPRAIAQIYQVRAVLDGLAAREAALARAAIDAAVLAEGRAAVAARKVTDTLKLADDQNHIASNVDRTHHWTVQTPQIFRIEIIRAAMAAVREQDIIATDDTAACELISQPVTLVPSPDTNPKVTTPTDLPRVELLLRQ